jgi:hypothetical protein
MRRALWLGVAALLLIVALYLYANRTGRYQLTALNTGFYVVLDTSTGQRWLFRGRVDNDRARYELQDAGPGVTFLDRVRP